MKEERLIGNSGIQAVRQQCLDLLAEIREQAGILNDYFEVTSNSEYIAAWVDCDGKVVFGLKADGKTFVGDADFLDDLKRIKDFLPLGSKIDWDALSIITLTDSPEFLNVETDEDGKVLSSRSKEGVKREYVGFETPHLKLVGDGMTEFQQALKDSGFNPGGKGDWSDYISNDGDNPLHLSEPRCAMVNITNANNTATWPTSKNHPMEAILEFYDLNGNYFKKNIVLDGQGNSSMNFEKRNASIDLFDASVYNKKGVLGKGDALKVRFGDWAAFDSFHLKAFYQDFFKGVSMVAYKLAKEVQDTRGANKNRPWKKALLKGYTIGTDQGNSDQIDNMKIQMDNGALCQPDGFPCVVYLNGDFYGLYTWAIKKHRDNYCMDKAKAEHIHIDAQPFVIFQGTPVNWDAAWRNMEIRNPKNLYYKEPHNGTYEYDADVNGQYEIADQATVDAWIAAGELPDGTVIDKKLKGYLQTTAKVHTYIENLADRIPEINAAETLEERQTLFNTYFDKENCMDYNIVNTCVDDADSFTHGWAGNWQWTTWDGIQWFVNNYDKDWSWGNIYTGVYTRPAKTQGGWLITSGVNPIGLCLSLFREEHKARWNLLKDTILSPDHTLEMLIEWMGRFGEDMYEKEYERWPNAPCNRDRRINEDYWEVINLSEPTSSSYPAYDNSQEYAAGDCCIYGSPSVGFRCINPCVGEKPCELYPSNPTALGYRDNIWRAYEYMKQIMRVSTENIDV